MNILHPCDAGHDDGLGDADELARLLAEEAAEGDGAREAREVDEDGGREGLPVQTVLNQIKSSLNGIIMQRVMRSADPTLKSER